MINVIFFKENILPQHYKIGINNNGKDKQKKYEVAKFGNSVKKNKSNNNTNDEKILSHTRTTQVVLMIIASTSIVLSKNSSDKGISYMCYNIHNVSSKSTTGAYSGNKNWSVLILDVLT